MFWELHDFLYTKVEVWIGVCFVRSISPYVLRVKGPRNFELMKNMPHKALHTMPGDGQCFMT